MKAMHENPNEPESIADINENKAITESREKKVSIIALCECSTLHSVDFRLKMRYLHRG